MDNRTGARMKQLTAEQEQIMREDIADRIFKERVNDLNGRLTESFTELSDMEKQNIADIAITIVSTPIMEHRVLARGLLADIVSTAIIEHCTPTDDEIQQELDWERGHG